MCAGCLLLAMLLLTGCGGSFFAQDDLQIVSVEAVPTEEGYTQLIITYSDDSERDPDIFAIPDGEAGKAGEKGTGIAKVSYQHDDQNRQTGITIEFTDKTLEPVTFDVPDGRSVVDIVPYNDTIAEARAIIFKYSDGTQSEPFYLPKGAPGTPGTGITSFRCVQNQDKSVTLDIEMNDGSDPIHVDIPAPAEGRGVVAMIGGEDDESYYIDVEYSDGSTGKISFQRPTKWFNGSTEPAPSLGMVGDYFFDTKHSKIYLKEEYTDGSIGWSEIVSFHRESYDVTFVLNDEGDAQMPTETHTFKVERGCYFSANGNGDIPIPFRPGYTFVGWCQKRVYDSRTMSIFTDFTPVFSNLTLYAIWEEAH